MTLIRRSWFHLEATSWTTERYMSRYECYFSALLGAHTFARSWTLHYRTYISF